MNFLRGLFSRRSAPPVLLKSLLAREPVPEAQLAKDIQTHFNNAGMQALIQGLEDEILQWQSQCQDVRLIAAGVPGFYAGGAQALTNLHLVLRKYRDSALESR